MNIEQILADAPAGAGNYHMGFERYYGGTNARNLDDLRLILELQQQNQQLAAQNAEWVAMVEASRIYLTELKESYCRDLYKSTAAERAADGKLLSGVYEFIKITPTHHLRDHDAEVGRAGFAAGFVAGDNFAMRAERGFYSINQIAEKASQDADQYAEKVRRGEV